MKVPVAVCGLALAACAAGCATSTQSWNYRTYDFVPTSPSETGYIVLTRSGDEYTLRMIAPGLSSCYVAPLRASVQVTEATTVVTPEPRHAHCERFRFVIRNDGTGGVRQDWNGTTWRTERRERLLTRRESSSLPP